MCRAFLRVAPGLPDLTTALLAALLLGGCDAGDAPRGEATPEPPPPFDWSSRIGLANLVQDTLCMAGPALSLAEGTPVLLVSPSEPQTFARASVVAQVQACAGGGAASSLAYYQLTSADALEVTRVYVAIIGIEQGARMVADTVILDIDGDGREDRFRECTSMEGLHLTIWTGQPLAGERRWHTYYYLGYDLEPSCTEAETG